MEHQLVGKWDIGKGKKEGPKHALWWQVNMYSCTLCNLFVAPAAVAKAHRHFLGKGCVHLGSKLQISVSCGLVKFPDLHWSQKNPAVEVYPA